jgi:hypothetical protein
MTAITNKRQVLRMIIRNGKRKEPWPQPVTKVGMELGRASCRWRVTSPVLSVAGWVHSSTMATFPEAPL